VKEFFERGVQGVESVAPGVAQGNTVTGIKGSLPRRMQRRGGIILNLENTTPS
jgi:hypothetical protein